MFQKIGELIAIGPMSEGGSQVNVRFSAGDGSFGSSTLSATLDKLGLRTRLSDTSSAVKWWTFGGAPELPR